MARRRFQRSVRLVVGVTLLAACSGDDAASRSVEPPPPPPPPRLVAVGIAFDSNYVRAGGRVQATAIPYDADGNVLTGVGVPSWSVTVNPDVATVSQTGLVTTISPGIAVIAATIDGVRGEDALVVRSVPGLAVVNVSLDSTILLVGRQTQARVVVLDSLGNEVSGLEVTWAVRGPATVATVSASGVVTALAPGTVSVTARVGGLEGEAILQVVNPSTVPVARVLVTLDQSTVAVGGSTQARFQAVDANGNLLPGKAVTWSMAPGSAAATVSAGGVVTAVAPGIARVVGTVDTVSGSATLTVVDSATGPSQVTLPTLPRDSVPLAYPQVRGRTWTVRSGDNLQTALNNARRGDEIVLEAGATFSGSYTLPAKAGTLADGWILVRSDRQAQLPPFGTRVTPAHASLMARIETTNSTAALQTAAGASGWWITGVEITVTPSFTGNNNGLVLLGDGSGRQNTLALVPSDLVLDRVYVHAHPTVGTSRCVALNSARSAVVHSWLADCHLKGFDSQAIAGWNGPGPFRIENNTLMGAGENVMFGGSDPAIAGLIPSDIVVRRNHVYTPIEWKGKWTKKNLFETKNVQRLLVEDNVLDGSWTDGQVGYAFVLKSANQSGRCTWCASRDITIRGNLIRNAGAGFNLTGLEGSNPHPVGERMTRLLLEHNVMELIMLGQYTGDGRLIQLLQNVSHLTVRNNTLTSTSTTLGQFLNVGSTPAATAFSFVRNVVSRGRFGLFSSAAGEGAGALNNIRTPVEFRDNVVVGPARTNYPPTTQFVASIPAAGSIANIGADEVRVRANAQLVVIP